jgi:hypothetical protein
MSWSNREAGHFVLVEADFTRLAGLPAGVGFRVYARSFRRRTVWLIGTGSAPHRGRKWDPGDHPFAEEAPLGSPSAVAAVRALARPFYDAIDRLAGTQSMELSLGHEMAALLGVPVLSFLSDPDADDELVCINEPTAVRRVVCQRAGLVLEFTGGVLEVSPSCPPALADLRGVRSAASPRPYNEFIHGLVVAEVDAFAGSGFADPVQVLPGVSELTLLGERTGGGRYRRLT